MISTIIIAQILGIVLTVMGASVIINKNNVSGAIDEITRNKGFLWFFGFITLVMGTLLITLNNVWGYGWLRLFIVIVGWLTFLKGAFIILFPDYAVPFYKKCNKASILSLGGIIAFIIGLLLLYRGFI